jgi:hypothetical protein
VILHNLAAERKAIACFHRLRRPVFIGELSVESGLSLTETHGLIDDFVLRGLVRQATSDEKRSMGVRDDCHVYVLNGTYSAVVASGSD